jgi:hypothetical protein
VDSRYLNTVTKKDAYPLSFRVLAYPFVYIREKTAFVSRNGQYQFKVVPFGLSGTCYLGEWVRNPPVNIPYQVDRATYSGCEVGHITIDDLKMTYMEIEAKITAMYTRWSRAGTAIKLWYQASVIPGDENSLQSSKRILPNLYGARNPARWLGEGLCPKKKGGMGMWCLVAKVRAASAMWRFNLETNRL